VVNNNIKNVIKSVDKVFLLVYTEIKNTKKRRNTMKDNTKSKKRINNLLSIIKKETNRINNLRKEKGVDRNGWVDESAERFLSMHKKEVNDLAGLRIYTDVC
jgi:DNA primase large subunit